MTDMVRDALDALIRDRHEDYASLSRMLGRNPAYIQQFIKRGSPQRLSEADRRSLAHYFRVSEDVLGGPPAAAQAVVMAAGSARARRQADLVLVPRLDVGASAGPGAVPGSEQPMARMAFDHRLLRDLTGSAFDALSMIRVAGDSMDPTLVDGDDILVDGGDSEDRLRDGIYVLRVEDSLIVKRLILWPEGERRFVIRSDNPHHPDRRDYDPASVHIIGRVIWSGRRVG